MRSPTNLVSIICLSLLVGNGNCGIAFAGCSSFLFSANGTPCFAANFDYPANFEAGFIFVQPRGLKRRGWSSNIPQNYRPSDEAERLSWTSTYGNVTFSVSCYGLTYAGINEKGLCITTMDLADTSLPRNNGRQILNDGVFQQYVLDQCATIDDVEDVLQQFAIETFEHYHVCDAQGKSLIVEFVDGKMIAVRGDAESTSVLTNSTLHASLSAYKKTLSIGKNDTYRSLERFCTIRARIKNDTVATEDRVKYSFRVLESAKNTSPTLWRIVFDPVNKRIHYKTRSTHQVRSIDLDQLDFQVNAKVKMLPVVNDLEGELSANLNDYSHQKVLRHWGRYMSALIELYRWPKIGNPDAWYKRSLRHLEAGVTGAP